MKIVDNGTLQLETCGFSSGQWGLTLEVNGVVLDVRDADVKIDTTDGLAAEYRFAEQGIVWRVVVTGDAEEAVIDSTIANVGSRALRLGKATLLSSSSVELGDAGDAVVALPWTSSTLLQAVRRLDDPEMPKVAQVKVQFFNRTQARAVQIGFLTFQRTKTEIALGVADGRLNDVRASCDFAGWELAPGTETKTETFRLVVGDDPYGQMEDWATQAAQRCGAKVWEGTPIGWLGWSWTDCVNGNQTYEQVALETLDAINNRLGGLGVNYLWTSMSNVAGSLPGNWLKWNDRCIPCGQEKFIQQVKARGFVPGFWVGPFYLCSMVDEAMERLGEAILRNPDGTPMVVCLEWRHGDAGLMRKKDRPCLYALDPSHPKSLAYVREVFETYRKWGVRYYMVDFVEAGAGNIGRFPYRDHHDKSLVAGPEAYTKFMRAMKDAAGEDAYLLSSTGPTLHNAGLVDGVRVGNDFGEGRAFSPEAFFYPASFVINGMGFWTGPHSALCNQASNFHTHRKLFLSDSANVLTVDKPIPLSHAQVAATIHAFSGGPTMLGDDIRTISEDRLSLIKKTLPRSQKVGRPVDLFDSPFPVGPRMFQRRIEKAWGRFDVVALYNFGPKTVTLTLDFVKLGLAVDAEMLVWDFWNEAFVGKAAGALEVSVPAETVKVLRLTANVCTPTLLGTDMHVMGGEMEIEEFSYDATSMTCRLRANRPAGERGMVFVHAPDSVYVKNFDGLHVAKDARDNSLVIGVPLVFDANGHASKEIRFGKLAEVLDMSKLDLA